MKKSLFYLPISLAALVTAAGVQAQSTPAGGSSDLPPKAGEASTQTMGVPNAKTTNMPSSEAPAASKDMQKDSQSMGAAPTSSVAPKAGEASTYVQGKPNADMKPQAMTRAQVRDELLGRRAAFEAERKAMLSSGHKSMFGRG